MRAALPALLAGAALLGACARPPQPGSALADLPRRYAAARDERAARIATLAADVIVRVDGRATRKLPALPATLALAAPERVRLAVSGFVGTALESTVDADSLWAWVPSERIAFSAPVESIGIERPGALAARVLGATWDPPADAWRLASSDSTGWRVGWREGADTLALEVDPEGRPLSAWVGRGPQGIRASYEDWIRVRGASLPGLVQLADDSGWARVRVQVEEGSAQGASDSATFVPSRHPNARHLGWSDLQALLSRRTIR